MVLPSEVEAMRQLLALIMVGLAAATGCGGSREEVRVYSSVPVESTQQRLDGVAANFFPGLVGGSH